MEKQIVKPRLEWVDTAKGICILLVILLHTSENIMDYSQSVYTMLRYIRLQLYYTIAGLFVSIKDIHTFIVKKINRGCHLNCVTATYNKMYLEIVLL